MQPTYLMKVSIYCMRLIITMSNAALHILCPRKKHSFGLVLPSPQTYVCSEPTTQYYNDYLEGRTKRAKLSYNDRMTFPIEH